MKIMLVTKQDKQGDLNNLGREWNDMIFDIWENKYFPIPAIICKFNFVTDNEKLLKILNYPYLMIIINRLH